MSEYKYYDYLMEQIRSNANYNFSDDETLMSSFRRFKAEVLPAYKLARERAITNYIKDHTTDITDPAELSTSLRKAYEDNPDHFKATHPNEMAKKLSETLRAEYERDPVRYKKALFSDKPLEVEEFPSGFRFAAKMLGIDKPDTIAEGALLAASLLPVGRGIKAAKAGISALRGRSSAVSEATGATLRASEGVGNAGARAEARAIVDEGYGSAQSAAAARAAERERLTELAAQRGEKDQWLAFQEKSGRAYARAYDPKLFRAGDTPVMSKPSVQVNPRAQAYVDKYTSEAMDSPVFSRTQAIKEGSESIRGALSTTPPKDEFVNMLESIFVGRSKDARELIGTMIQKLKLAERKGSRDEFNAIQDLLLALARGVK